ncbi:hypothetical protein L486_05714 [Kwoniella mangroviensis CBS 10435]|uniref:Uncharacterized protein n=1 Tax=Kwoniella mangroviensis CBS 10435 TaxID=1331196 RepID=A0A1B9IMQ7_9TREE|nr:uncharacterized protein I203_07361 [Kwoniella mangroviensis CBS 8507]OCF56859.1 hypothetical protein L486_05714 [Kwoniella mangroviensis CBS 10435]OCF63663.1 hypothetical protein I203_07361 [Kwoniella mangroviensis CBS 8507]
MPVTLTDLPIELLHHIHFLALNPFLPCTNHQLHSIFHRPSSYYAATYLLRLYSAYGPTEILTRSLRHLICTVEVAEEIRKIWDRRRGYVEPPILSSETKRRNSTPSIEKGKQRRDRSVSRSPSPTPPPEPTAPALQCTEIPRRLFRDPFDPGRPIHPLIKYLFDKYQSSPNSHKGYPLFRAILTSNYELVTFLLEHGADPGIKDCFALDIAISMKDLKMVKLLVERNPSETTPSPVKEGSKNGKKVKLGDRVEIGTRMVEKAIEKGSQEIINYFVYEKKVMPPLHSIMNIGKTDRNRSQKRKRQMRPALPTEA